MKIYLTYKETQYDGKSRHKFWMIKENAQKEYETMEKNNHIEEWEIEDFTEFTENVWDSCQKKIQGKIP